MDLVYKRMMSPARGALVVAWYESGGKWPCSSGCRREQRAGSDERPNGGWHLEARQKAATRGFILGLIGADIDKVT